MISQWNVLSHLKKLCDIPESEEENALELCEISLQRVLGRLKEDADRGDIRILSLAVAYAFQCVCLKEEDDIEAFQAGDIRVSKKTSDKTKNAEKMVSDALLDISPLFKDESFYFGSVEI